MADALDLENLVQNPAKLERHLSSALDTAFTVGTAYSLKIIGAIIILAAGWTIAGALQKAILRAGKRSARVDITIFTFLASLARYAAIAFTIIAVLSSFGVETTSFVAVLGAAGLAIGLALQGTLSHVASGAMLIIFRPFRIGDVIEAAGISGTVRAITLFVTEIDTADNVHILVPNGLIWSKDIKNYSANNNRRAELKFLVSYADSVETAIGLVKQVLENDTRVQKTPAPVVGVQSMTVDGVVLVAWFWTAAGDFGQVPMDANREVKAAFDQAKITMSFPQKTGFPVGAPRIPI
ncbi:MAG: mechanosensitive ion channel [Rhodospirillaceae bacterium]|nr:mechanosensitive ion channel [Rhodospirillaceae bacterium]